MEILASRVEGLPKTVAVAAARIAIGDMRRRLLDGEKVDLSESGLADALRECAAGLLQSSLRPVINATGVILHTNLGRAPLAPAAAEAAALAGASYTNLEYDLDNGSRGSRQDHIEPALIELSGAEAALAVNNNAAAVLLALAALAGRGEVVVSRGQLIEIGGSFRVPEILAQAGAQLVEVGTTNRTKLSDYERAIGPNTTALLRVHQSNFRLVGFSEDAAPAALGRLAAATGLPMIDDLGSGALGRIQGEPTFRESVEAGATLVCGSADKLMGGPQAGLLVGESDAIRRCREHPLARALRIDKMQLAALEATLRLHRLNEGPVPVPEMLTVSEAELRAQAERLVAMVGERASVLEDRAQAGGGSMPGVELPGPVCAIDPGSAGADALAGSLREGDPPIIARVRRGRVVLDPRTIDPADIPLVGDLARCAVAAQ